MPDLTRISGSVVLPDGSVPYDGRIHFTPAGWDSPAVGGVQPPATRSFTLGPSGGLVDVYLSPSTTSMREMPYRVSVTHFNVATRAMETTDLGLISVPEVAEGDSVSIRSLLSDPGVIPTAPDALAQVIAKALEVDADRAAAQAARTAAQAAEAAAEASAATASTAAASAVAAEVNVEAAFANANVYETASAGRASVADGGQFIVAAAGATEFVRYRRDSSATQTELARYPMAAFVANRLAPILRILTTGGTANAQTANAPDATFTAYADGQVFLWFPNATNTAAMTLAVGGLAALPVRKASGTDAAAGDVRNGIGYLVRVGAGTSEFRLIGNARSDLFASPALTGTPTAPTAALGTNTTQIATTAFSTAATTALKGVFMGSSWTNNVFPDPEFSSYADGAVLTDAFGWTTLSGNGMIVTSANGRKGVRNHPSATAINLEGPLVPVSAMVSGRISASLLIESKPTTVAASLRARLRFVAADGATTVNVTDQTGSDDAGNAAFYTRNLPAAAITAPTWLSICEGIAIPAGAAFVRMGWRIETTEQAIMTRLLIREGYDASWKTTVSSGSAGGTVSAGTGGTHATIDAALDAIGGTGTIILRHSRSYGTSMRITASKITGPLRIIGDINQSTGQRPRIILSSAVTGIEAVAGYGGRVFRFPTTLTATPPWVWLHDTPDAATAIASADRRPQHAGRASRLPSTRIRRIASAGSLAATLTAMQASDSPQVFYDGGWLYVTGVAGSSLIGADIRVGTTSGLFIGGSLMGLPEVQITNLDLLYGGITSNIFERSVLENVSVIGARDNGISHAGMTVLRNVETAGSGSFVDATGDGVNGHTYSVLFMDGCWSHDNLDDGQSDHEFGKTFVRSSLFEFNGGTAVAPAYGCEAIYEDCESLSNQQVIGRKAAAFLAVGLPSEGSPVDTGVDTIAVFRRCISRNDTVSFKDFFVSTSGAVKAICEDCVSINAATMAFDVFEVSNCRVVGSATAKNAATTVRAQGVLVS